MVPLMNRHVNRFKHLDSYIEPSSCLFAILAASMGLCSGYDSYLGQIHQADEKTKQQLVRSHAMQHPTKASTLYSQGRKMESITLGCIPT